MEEPPERPRSRPPPEGESRLAITERMLQLVTGMKVQNAVTIALLALVALPAFVVWELLRDPKLREQFMSSAHVVDNTGVPCLVVATNLVGQPVRYVVGVAYESDGRIEYDVVVRSPGVLSPDEIRVACTRARHDADVLSKALEAATAKGSPSETK